MIFGIELLNIVIWLLIGLFIGGVLPFIAAFLAPAMQLTNDVATKVNIFTQNGLFSVFRKLGKTLLYTCSGALFGPILYRILSGDNYVNYSADGFFYSILGAVWFFIVFKFTSSQNSKKDKTI